ncbi:MAG: FeoB-associated Cys-rich membrane protein [Lachnospiraceae bacterium]|nr:FeoB-associated Cys-rich membrane protein [Lachnospiraceae bacterium]
MNLWDFILIGIVVILVFSSIRKIKQRSKDGGCSSCSGCGVDNCASRKNEEENKK